ncbi:uncharacterized protein LOC142625133 [Castanea sativa]|uniref:uncharacterized protein LOC142625133 n=1 Tax=Castanea sativa TaxID=21020 RepID=UPI003F652A6E
MTSDSTTNTQSQTGNSAPSSSAVMVDEYANNPFFLPANKNPSLVLTSQPLTGPENYLSWARSMFLAWSSRNKFGFVNGSISQIHLLHCSIHGVDIDLKDRLSQGNTPRLFELQKEISHLSQGSLSTSQLEAQHKEHVFHFLMGLNDSYGNVISQILLIEPFPSLNAVAMYANNSKAIKVILMEENEAILRRTDQGNKAMENQVSAILPSGTYGLDGFSSTLGASLPPTNVYHNSYMAPGSSTEAQTVQHGHQVALVLTTPSIPHSQPSTSTSPSCSSNFSDLAQWSMIGLGKEHNGLYLLQDSGSKPSASTLAVAQKRLPFTVSTHVSSKPFELIHCDLWGPFATNTIDGFKYFLTIVDDYSRCTRVYLLKHKSETQVFLPQFANMANTQFNSKIQTIRSDNGTEFFLKDFFHSNGILHQLACVDTLQQNAIVEWKHQHILNVARGLKSKFAPRARKCVFLGYPYGIKGYKVLDLDSNSVYISRDVVFYEHIFPYVTTSQPSSSYLDDFIFPHCTSDYTAPISDHITPPIQAFVIPIDSVASADASVDPIPSIGVSTHLSVPIATHDTSSYDPLLSDSFLSSSPNSSLPVLRRSTRPHNPPSYLSDYSCKFVCTKPGSGLPYDILDCLDYSYLGPRFHSFVMPVTSPPSEPISFHQAV